MKLPVIFRDRLNDAGKLALVRSIMALEGGSCRSCGADLDRPGASPYFDCPNADCPSHEKELEKE